MFRCMNDEGRKYSAAKEPRRVSAAGPSLQKAFILLYNISGGETIFKEKKGRARRGPATEESKKTK